MKNNINSFKNGYENLNFVKWAGGKLQLINQIKKYLPSKIDRYFEPFVGGGALFFYIMQKYKPKYALISDVNEDLIITYKVIRDNIDELIKELEKHKKKHKEDFEKFGNKKASSINNLNKKRKLLTKSYDIDLNKPEKLILKETEEELKKIKKSKREEDKLRYYYVARNYFNKNKEMLSNIERAAYFIYFNKAGFNGMYRVNPKGEFNIPKGDTKDFIINKERLYKTSEILNKNVEIKCMSYEKINDKLKKGDFIYFDPPYAPLKKNSFTTYTKDKFLEKEQKKLAHFCKDLNNKEFHFMLSNHNTDLIRDIYSEFDLKIVSAKRMINCDGTKRGNIDEVLVINY